MKRMFIINPTAGGGIKNSSLEEVKKYCHLKFGEFSHVFCKNREDMILQTRKAIQESALQIIAWGGDGTVNAVVNGFFEEGKMLNPDCSLVVSNQGSGSDFYKSVILNKRPAKWYETIDQHVIIKIDVGRVHFGHNDFKDQHFINITGIGLSADVVAIKERTKAWVPKSLCYVLPSLKSMMTYQSNQAKVQVDGVENNVNLMAVFVANGKFSGGGMKFGYFAELDDGQFDITIFEKMPIFEMLFKMRTLYTGRFENVSKVHKYSGKMVTITSATPIHLEIDGELYGHSDCTIALDSKILGLCTPK